MNNKSIKKLVYQLLKQEIQEHGIQVEILPTTRFQNFFEIIKEAIQSKKENQESIIETVRYWLAFNKSGRAYYDYSTHRLKVLIDSIRQDTQNKEQYVWFLAKYAYHEYKHVIINEFLTPTINTLADFYCIMENLINPTTDYYLDNHDTFYDEILANQYGVEKAEKFLKETPKYKTLYTNFQNTIELEKLLHEIHYQNYDIHPVINEINNIIKASINAIDLSNLEPDCQIIAILYQENGRFKSPEELMKTESWTKLPKEAKMLILSSDAYLADLNYNTITLEELNLIMESLIYKRALESKKILINRQLRNKLEFLSKKINKEEQYNLEIYLKTLLVLNSKEQSAKINLQKLSSQIKKIEDLIQQKANSPKTLTYHP